MKNLDFDKYREFLASFKPFYEDLENPEKRTEKAQSQIDEYLSDDFDTYEMSEGDDCTYEDFCYMNQEAILHAIYLINTPGLYDKVFKEGKLTPVEFFTFAYFYGYMAIVTNKKFGELFKAYVKFTDGLSLKKLLQGIKDTNIEGVDEVSEVDFYDKMQRLSTREITLFIEQIDTKREIKNQLKDSIISNDENKFFQLCRENNLNFQKPAIVLNLWISLCTSKDFFSQAMTGTDNNSVEKAISSLMHKEDLELDEEEFDRLDNLKDFLNPNNEGIPELNYYELYRITSNQEAFIIVCFRKFERFSTDTEGVDQLKKVIQSYPYYNRLYETETLKEWATCNYRVYAPLIEFKDTFLTEKTLPEQVAGEKSTSDYYDSNNCFTQLDLIHIYKLLVKYDMIGYEDETFYSLIYRLSNKYKGESKPTVIVWRGVPNDLYYFVEWFTGGSTAGKKWDKTVKFFIFENGESPRKDPCHYKNKPSSKMLSFEKEFKKQ